MSVALDSTTAMESEKAEFDADFDLGETEHGDGSGEPAQACCAEPTTSWCTIPC